MTSPINGAYTPQDLANALGTKNKYEVIDTAQNITGANAGNWAAMFSANSPVTKLTVLGNNPQMTVTSAQYKTAIQNNPNLMAKAFKTGNDNTSTTDFTNLKVENVADATTLDKANRDNHVAKMTLSMTGADLSRSLKDILTGNKIGTGDITVTDTATGTVKLTYDQFIQYGGNKDTGGITAGSALDRFAGSTAIFSITGATVAQANKIKDGGRIASMSVADYGANIAAGLTTLGSLSKLKQIQQTDTLTPIALTAANYMTAASAGASSVMAKLATNVKLSIDATAVGTDVAALATKASTLGNTIEKLKVTTASTSSLTYEQYKAIHSGMVDETGRGRNLKINVVSGANVDAALGMLSDSTVQKITVTANSVNFSSSANADKLYQVLNSAKVDAGTVTNSSISAAPISISFAQFTDARWGGIEATGAIAASTTAGTALLNKFATAVSFNVTGASITQADLLKGGAKVATISVTDTAANIGLAGNITKLAGLLAVGTTPTNKLAAIKQSDTATIAMTATAYLANRDTLATLGTSSKLSITATAAEVDDIIARATTDNDTLSSITISDASTGTAALSYAQYQKYGNLIVPSTGQGSSYKTDISGATAQQATGLLKDARVQKIDISEAKTSLLSSQNTKDILSLLANAKSKTIAFTGTGSSNLSISASDFLSLGGKSDGTIDSVRSNVATALSKLAPATSGVTFSITNASVAQATNATGFAKSGSFITKMSINDTGVNIATGIADLNSLGSKLTSIQQTDRATKPLALTFAAYSAAASAGTMAKLATSSKLSITAAAADIPGDSGLLKLATNAKNSFLKITISNSDAAAVSLTYDQYKKLGDEIFDKTGLTKNYTANVTTQTFAQAKELLNDTHVTKISIADSIEHAVGADASLMSALASNSKVELTLTAANNADVQNNLGKLHALGASLKSITNATVADVAHPLSLSYAELNNYSSTLAKINGGSYMVNLSGEQSLAVAKAILGADKTDIDAHVAKLAINTSQTSMQDNLDTLKGYASAGKLSKIVDSASNNVSLAVTATQYNANTSGDKFSELKTALTAGLATGKTLSFSVSGVGAAAAKTVGDDSNVTTLNVSDNAANIAANLAKLAGAGSKLVTITQSDKATVAPALTMSDYERLNTYADQTVGVITKDGVLKKISNANSAYTITLTNVSAATAAARSAPSNVSGIVINDTSAAIGSNLAAIAGIAASKLLTVGNSLGSSAISSALTSGTISGTAAIASGDLYINGENIGALSAAASVAERLTALETAINLQTGTTGVTATKDAATSSYRLTVADGRAITVTSNNAALQTSVSGFAAKNAAAGVGGTSVTSLAATSAGDLKINGTDIDGVGTATSVTNRLSDLVGAINAKTATTGVAAAINSANGYQLTSADGRTITVTSTNTAIQTAVSGFAVKSGTSVTSGAIELTAAQYKTNILTPAAAPTSSTAAYAYTGGGMTINGSTIAAAANDGVSFVAGVKSAATGATSALAVKTAINAVTAHNVTAVASTAVTSGVISSWGTMAAGDLYINGQDIGTLAAASTAAARVTQLVAAINTKTGATGVTAAANNDATYTLTAADGRNIDITSNNAASQTSKSGFAVEAAANGAGGTAATYYGKLTLTASSSFTIAGDVTGSGLAAATYHDKSTEGSTVATGFNPGLIGKLDNLTLTAVSAEDAEALKNKDNINNFKVNESPANLYANGYSLANNTKVAAGDITITGTNPIFSMPFASYYGTSDIVPLFAKVSPDSRYQVVLNDMSAADATNPAKPFKTDSHVATVSVSDTAANIKSKWDDLKALGDTLSKINISGTSTPNLSITYDQYSSSTALLSKINGLRLAVTGVSAANATAVAANTSVVGLTVSDTADNIEAKFDDLNALSGTAATSGTAAVAGTSAPATGAFRITVAGKLTAVEVSGTTGSTIDISKGQYHNGDTPLEVLLSNSSSTKVINIKDLSVADALNIATDDPAVAVNTGSTAYAYSSGTMTINGKTISAAADDTVSYVGGLQSATTGITSAKAMATTINLANTGATATGVAATASTSLTSAAITTAAAMIAADLVINGVDIGVVSAPTTTGATAISDRVDQLVTAINAKTSGAVGSGTGVTATRVAGANTYTLTAADGRNIDVTSTGSAATGLTTSTQYGTLKLTSTDAFTIGGTVTGSRLVANTYADDTVYDTKVLVSVKDSKASIEANLDALKIVDNSALLSTVQTNDSPSAKVNISGATYLAETFKDLLPNLVGGITVSNVTAANFASTAPNAVSDVNVSSFTFKDTAANIVSVLGKLAPGTDHLTTTKLTEIRESEGTSTPLPVTVAQVTDYLATLALVQDSTGSTKPGLNVST